MAVDVVSVPARNRSLAAFRRLNSDNDTKHKIDLKKCTHLYNETQGTKKQSAFDRKSSSGVKR